MIIIVVIVGKSAVVPGVPVVVPVVFPVVVPAVIASAVHATMLTSSSASLGRKISLHRHQHCIGENVVHSLIYQRSVLIGEISICFSSVKVLEEVGGVAAGAGYDFRLSF